MHVSGLSSVERLWQPESNRDVVCECECRYCMDNKNENGSNSANTNEQVFEKVENWESKTLE